MIWRKLVSLDFTILAGLLCIASAIVGWMTFIDGTLYNPVAVFDRPVWQVDKPHYSPGQQVLAKMEIYKGRDIVGEIKWNLIDTRIYPYAPREISMPHGAIEKWIPVERIPECAAGDYHFEGIVSYRVNPLRVVTYKVETEHFKVLPSSAH